MTHLNAPLSALSGPPGAVIDMRSGVQRREGTNLKSMLIHFERTEHQVRPFEGFKPEEIRHRDTTWGNEDAPRTPQLASPPEWSQTEELTPCQRDLEFTDADGWSKIWDPALWGGITQKKAAEKANVLCADCPVRIQCLKDALEDEGTLSGQSRYLVRGGMTPKGRATFAREQAVNMTMTA